MGHAEPNIPFMLQNGITFFVVLAHHIGLFMRTFLYFGVSNFPLKEIHRKLFVTEKGKIVMPRVR